MLTELAFAVGIVALSGLFLWGLFTLSRAFSSPKESPNEHPIQGMSWFESCYEPCMRDPGQTSDSCVMMCAWNLM